jgi:hypothetical protein
MDLPARFWEEIYGLRFWAKAAFFLYYLVIIVNYLGSRSTLPNFPFFRSLFFLSGSRRPFFLLFAG